MRTGWVVVVLFVVTLVPKSGKAQVYDVATPPPQVTATAAQWQVNNDAIVFQGIVYYPTGFMRPFDGNVMGQLGYFDNVPVYADKTLEPYSVIFVPVARGMRMYERERVGALAGTTGSQTPTFPVQPTPTIPPETPVGTTGIAVNEGLNVPVAAERPIPTPTATVTPSPAPAPTHIETVPLPRATDGVWIRYDGAKWYSDGAAVPFSADRFARIGTYRGFPVFRDRARPNTREIWVAVVLDGPLAPYARR